MRIDTGRLLALVTGMRSWIALAVTVTTLTSSITEAGVISGVCKPSVDPQLEQISELLETIAPDQEAPFTLDPRVVVVEISTPSYEGPREIGRPSGENKTAIASWLPVVTDDEDFAPRPILAIHRFEPYHRARVFHAQAMDVVHENISAPLGKRYGSMTVVKPKWRSAWNANNATGLIDVAAESMHGTALIVATGGIGIAYQNLKLAEDYWSSPLDVGQGASEMVDGARTGDVDRTLAGYTQASSGVVTAVSPAIPLVRGARALAGKPKPPAPNPPVPMATPTGPRYTPTNFAAGELDKHFVKHANEFGSITRGEYLQGARSLLGRDVGGEIQGAVRPNGDVLRYNSVTNEFAAGRADGTIRTYFLPKDGIVYWQKQVGP